MTAIADRILNIPFVRRSDALRTFVVAAWLGWQIESNWADPFLFAIYSLARPIASVLILVVMYAVITDGAMEQPIFSYIYLGNALYILVSSVITGVSWAVIDDREHYRTMKQLYTAPLDGYAYLMGRGVARMLIGTISVLITIGFGLIAFHLPIRLATIDWGLLLLSTALGVASLAAMGLMLGSLTMMLARHFWAVGEMVAGSLYLFSGAIFPLEVLPPWLRPLGFVFPVTYWLEAARRALLGPQALGFPTLAHFSDWQLVGILSGMTAVLIVVSGFFYRWALHQAKEKGLIDMETAY
ncbi:MAG TPA: ABC transporter permease [Chloroflexi bacterium]|nr:ABC transporter permease [Chloroflexota bacterium]